MRNDIPCELGGLPFNDDGSFTRSIWVVFVSELGAWTHAVFPFDSDDDIASMSRLAASATGRWLCETDEEEALVVFRRLGPREATAADWHVFRLVREAAAGRDPAPWSFHVATPNGALELMPDGKVWPDVPSPW